MNAAAPTFSSSYWTTASTAVFLFSRVVFSSPVLKAPDQQQEHQADDHYADHELDEGGTGLGPVPRASMGHQWTARSSPYMGRITETATKPTAPPTAITRVGSMRLIMLRTL